MTTAYSPLLGLALPVTGELSGTWGTTVNNYITSFLDSAVSGTQTLSSDLDVTLTVTNGTALGSTSSQYAVLLCSGVRSAIRNITAPAQSKTYVVINSTTVVLRSICAVQGLRLAFRLLLVNTPCVHGTALISSRSAALVARVRLHRSPRRGRLLLTPRPTISPTPPRVQVPSRCRRARPAASTI